MTQDKVSKLAYKYYLTMTGEPSVTILEQEPKNDEDYLIYKLIEPKPAKEQV